MAFSKTLDISDRAIPTTYKAFFMLFFLPDIKNMQYHQIPKLQLCKRKEILVSIEIGKAMRTHKVKIILLNNILRGLAILYIENKLFPRNSTAPYRSSPRWLLFHKICTRTSANQLVVYYTFQKYRRISVHSIGFLWTEYLIICLRCRNGEVYSFLFVCFHWSASFK